MFWLRNVPERMMGVVCFFFQAEDGIRDLYVTGVQTCALPIYSSGCRITTFIASSNSAEAKKPTRGENSSAFPTLVACPQSTPEVPSWPCIKALAMPTPMIDPISVCELEAGRPRYQVPRFQMIAAINSANTIANPAELPT